MSRQTCWKLLAVSLILVVALAACGPSLKDQIIGKWEPVEAIAGGTATFEFTQDGKIIISSSGFSIEGTYDWLDENTIHLKFGFEGGNQESEADVEISGDALKMTSNNTITEFKRVK